MIWGGIGIILFFAIAGWGFCLSSFNWHNWGLLQYILAWVIVFVGVDVACDMYFVPVIQKKKQDKKGGEK